MAKKTGKKSVAKRKKKTGTKDDPIIRVTLVMPRWGQHTAFGHNIIGPVCREAARSAFRTATRVEKAGKDSVVSSVSVSLVPKTLHEYTCWSVVNFRDIGATGDRTETIVAQLQGGACPPVVNDVPALVANVQVAWSADMLKPKHPKYGNHCRQVFERLIRPPFILARGVEFTCGSCGRAATLSGCPPVALPDCGSGNHKLLESCFFDENGQTWIWMKFIKLDMNDQPIPGTECKQVQPMGGPPPLAASKDGDCPPETLPDCNHNELPAGHSFRKVTECIFDKDGQQWQWTKFEEVDEYGQPVPPPEGQVCKEEHPL